VTTLRQWAANRENAQKSTGPRTEDGKRRSRRNALRHGLTAETVVESLEDTEDYRAFEATVIADYDAHTAVERELVLRLSSLLWRIRRATGIETDPLRIQAEIIRERAKGGGHPPFPSHDPPQPAAPGLPRLGYPVLRPVGGAVFVDEGPKPEDSDEGCEAVDGEDASAAMTPDPSRQLTHCFLRLANLDNCDLRPPRAIRSPTLAADRSNDVGVRSATTAALSLRLVPQIARIHRGIAWAGPTSLDGGWRPLK